MPETPDFEQMARVLAETDRTDLIALNLRQLWNARGAADVAAVRARRLGENADDVIEKLDR